jgi:hypothetical protein
VADASTTTEGGEGADASGTPTLEAGPDVGADTSAGMTGDSSDKADAVADAHAGQGGDAATLDGGEQASADSGITDAGLDCSQGCSAEVIYCTKPQDCDIFDSGLYCCLTPVGINPHQACTASCPEGSLRLCGDSGDCSNGRSCEPLLSYFVCEAPDGNPL